MADIEGYRNENGTIGIRRWRLALPSVVCSTVAAERAVDGLERGRTVAHPVGCAQVGRDKEQTLRTLVGIGAHPNVSRVAVVGLGCEGVQASVIADGIRERGRAVQVISIQTQGGIEETARAARSWLASGEGDAQRVPVRWHDLVVGVVGHPQVDRLSPLLDGLTQRGARLLLTGEARPGAPRIDYAAPMANAGQVAVMVAEGGEASEITGLAAAGAHLILAVGDLRHLGGHAVVPVVRIGIDPALKDALGDDLDGWIGDQSPAAWIDYLADVVDGRAVPAETWGGDLFAIARVGPTL